MLSQLQLDEAIITAMVNLLKTNLPAVITSLNATITDGYLVDEPVQYLPYVPVPSTLQGGMPIIGVRELGARFIDDLQVNMDATHRYAVMAIIQQADQETLAWQLRRTAQAVAATIQNDRVTVPSQMKDQAGVWSVNFEATEPGPLFGEPDLTNPNQPPTSYMSYTAIIFNSTRTEV